MIIKYTIVTIVGLIVLKYFNPSAGVSFTLGCMVYGFMQGNESSKKPSADE